MELRCFLAHTSGLPCACHVDLPLSSTTTTTTVIGRHSPELYWHLGNDARCSRRMMSLTVGPLKGEVPAGAGAQTSLGLEIHPQVNRCLTLKCLGNNPLAIIRGDAGGTLNSTATYGDNRTVIRRNASTVLRIGDKVEIGHRVLMQVVVARVCVNEALKEPILTPLDESPTCSAPNCGGSTVRFPTIYINKQWSKLITSVRSTLIDAALKQQQRQLQHQEQVLTQKASVLPAAASMQTAVPFSESFPAETPLELAESLSKSSSAAGILAAGHSLSNSIGGAASESPLLHDGDVTVPACPGEKQAPQVIIIGDSLDDKSLLSSIEEVDYPGKSQVHRGDTFPVDRCHTPRPQDSGSYVDTLDERLDEVFFALEKGAEVTGHVLAERSMAVLGGSQLVGSGCLDRKAARTPTAAVSRDQLQMSDRLHRHPRSGSRSVANYAHQDDSQVVYYRH